MDGTSPLTGEDDLAARMVTGIDAWLSRALTRSISDRDQYWHRDDRSHEAYVASIESNRARFARLIGVIDARVPIEMLETKAVSSTAVAEDKTAALGEKYDSFAVRWSVLPGVEAEGLLLQPRATPVADVVALPDCDWTPEMLAGIAPGVPEAAQFGHRLADHGCRVLIPVLIDRRNTYSGNPDVLMVNQPHREFIYRAAYEFGRYTIGYEVQKILAALDWFSAAHRPIGVFGYGEGGLLALYTAALDTRIEATVVSGYFQPRERLYGEPIYRNLFGLLTEFGDAEIASLVVPRPLIIEACRHPEISGPPEPTSDQRDSAAPGSIATPPLSEIQSEFARLQHLVSGLQPMPTLTLQTVDEGTGEPGDEKTMNAFMKALVGTPGPGISNCPSERPYPKEPVNVDARQKRQFQQLVEHTQHLMRESEYRRAEFWSQADRTSVASWEQSCRWYRAYCWDEIIGRLPEADVPMSPSTRRIYETSAFIGYEVTLDVYEDVFAYGIILIPKDLDPGERRPVVVCQHGLEGRPQQVANPDVDDPCYHAFACRLAERGYVTYAPQNPYIGENRFRELLRKAHPLKQTLYGFIVRQHERTLDWLSSLPFVDPDRIAFYGLSYGGKAAMRIPALLTRYCLSICSADYNEWIWKCTSNRAPCSYMFGSEYDMPEYNLGETFNYAELSWLICPRPFMVERGHEDGVGLDEWVSYEYAKTRRQYIKLGLVDRTEMEVFDGPHTINGKGTFEFLDRHLRPPR